MQHDWIRQLGEGLSISIIIASFAKLLPPLAALCSIAWYGVLAYDRFFKKKLNETETD